ncbi:helix-turn-helix transcriptional regulator [Nocardioides sp. GY 10127]|uniref:helix-turn-helix domain-containing protein n=1 Tax=Nocardioides sp. GY 10127 TaxID=2569762 RepID=UPI0010A91553|nr:helix-turn-helix transcriptional regulator [Nocardioides sp. GY 10127]TIC78818.1 helix-turn-helix transcriptional regulator [Nocardioides sp. GY 10127]
MSWSAYVRQLMGDEPQKAVAARAGIEAPVISRWLGGQSPRPDGAARLARAYGRPVLEAFVAAGFLTEEEAGARPAAAPNYDALTNEQLLGLVRSRMREEVVADGDAAPTSGARRGPTQIVRGQVGSGGNDGRLSTLLTLDRDVDPYAVDALDRLADDFLSQPEVDRSALVNLLYLAYALDPRRAGHTFSSDLASGAAAAREVGRPGRVAGKRRQQDAAGEPLADDPDDMEPR